MTNLFILLFAYFVSFTDKPTNTTLALSERAIAQRTKWNIPTDDLDYPVDRSYVDSICRMGATLCHTSRWFNGATFTMDDSLAMEVAQLPFVERIECTRDNGKNYSPRKKLAQKIEQTADTTSNITDTQLALFNLLPLHQAGFEGQGILMTVCDGGFYKANTLSAFRQSELELGHLDFTDDTDGFYGSTGTHGTECLSTITGLTDGYHGAATRAQYYLMRSEEDVTESPKEMDNLIAAFEAADSLGVNVFSVSLGYAEFDNDNWTLPKSAMDGKSTRCSQAATIAARKGMLICVAAGNEGNSDWHIIDSPADADSVLTVGAVDIYGNIGGFSSYGPTADGRVKPEVCAVGVQAQLVYPDGSIVRSNGTSFATPLLAGMAASLWSALPDENAMQIRERIIRSAHHYTSPDPDNHYGYGIPDAYAAYLGRTATLADTPATTHSIKYIQGNNLYIYHNGKTYTIYGTIAQ